MERRRWSQIELLKALSLYCQIPFGHMHARNQEVRSLAREIGRTPSAVALKLVNFASLDPELRSRGVRGMSNTSRDDRDIWNQYYGHWRRLAEVNPIALNEPQRANSMAAPTKATRVKHHGVTEAIRSTRTRLGQQFFRNAVLAAYEGRCCVTGISAPELLRASHIVPWAESVKDRLNPQNGICLNALHDAAFDRGLITFSTALELRISGRLKTQIPSEMYATAFEQHADREVTQPERLRPNQEFLKYHRENVFVE